MNGALRVSGESPAELFGVFDAVTAYRKDLLGSMEHFVRNLSDSWCKVRQTEMECNNRENHFFNPLRSITIKETDHSRILGCLLDPQGSHGQNRLFLDSFLGMLCVDTHGSAWTVTVEAGRVDILLRRDKPASVIIIENKAQNAQDQGGQLYRYWFQEMYSLHPHEDYSKAAATERFRVVYLPPGGYARPSEQSLRRPLEGIYASCPYPRLPEEILDCRSFKTDIADWLHTMAKQELGVRLKTFLNLYAEIWSI